MAASLDNVLPGDLPGTAAHAGPELNGAGLPDVDRRISSAFSDLGQARSRFADSPSGETVSACLAAEAMVNELLELRLRLTRKAAALGA
jgi:hypothetical protein